MARKKIELQYISNDSSRKASFKKRKRGLLKKARELTTLCDVKGCLILYGQNGSEPEVWPSIPEAIDVLAELKRMPQMEQSKKMMDQEAFTRNRLSKLEDQLRKLERENRDMQTHILMNDCLMGRKTLDGVDEVTELPALGLAVEMKLKEVKRQIKDSKTSKTNNNTREAKKEKGKAVVNVVEEAEGFKKADQWIANYDYYMNPIGGGSSSNPHVDDSFVMPPFNIVEPAWSSGTSYNMADEDFKMN